MITPKGMLLDIRWLASKGYWYKHSFKELCAKHWQSSELEWVEQTLTHRRRLNPGSKLWRLGAEIREIVLREELKILRKEVRRLNREQLK